MADYSPALAAANAFYAIKHASARFFLDGIKLRAGISRRDYADLMLNCRALAAEKRGEGRLLEVRALEFAADCFDPKGNVPGAENIDRHNAGLAALEQAARLCEG